MTGIITRQIVEKAVFHRLEELSVREYMITDFSTARPTDSIERVKEIIIAGNQRFLPVTEEGRLIGAVTRTDLLRVLEDEIRKSVLGKLDYHDVYEKRKNVKRLMEERISLPVLDRLISIGGLADEMGFHAYLVGGFVRDLLLRIENFDIDVVIEGDGIRFAEELGKRLGIKTRMHKEFGTAKVLYRDGFKVDVATARLEYYKAPAALPVVEHSSLKLDLYRRDFTINTLAISLNKNTFGELIDFFGAQRDIKEKSIRVLHSLSFVEDPTRVFRAVRFEQRFGFQIGKFTVNLIKNAVKMSFLSKIKGPRIWRELVADPLGGRPRADHEEAPGARPPQVHPPFPDVRPREGEALRRDGYGPQVVQPVCTRASTTGSFTISSASWTVCPWRMWATFREGSWRLNPCEESFPTRWPAVGEVMGRLSTAIRFMKKSEVYRQLELLSQEGRLFVMAKDPFGGGEEGGLELYHLRGEPPSPDDRGGPAGHGHQGRPRLQGDPRRAQGSQNRPELCDQAAGAGLCAAST